MKKTILIAIMGLSATSAYADSVVKCVARDGTPLSANFNISSSEKTTVDLLFSNDRTYSGECRSVPGAIELAIVCSVMTSTDSGYDVSLYSMGSSTLSASVTPWSIGGKGERMSLSCGR